MIQQERRSHSRKTLNPLPYINLAPDTGGIVLDVSEQGLRFRATTTLEPSGPIHFSFSAHSDLVEGVAELVWTDEAKKTGGLRFTELPESAREAIRKWPHESDLQLSVGQDFMLHLPPRDESSRAGAPGHGVFDTALQSVGSSFRNLGSTLREGLPSGRKEGLAALSLLSVTIVVILLSTFSYVRHREVGEWLVRLGTRISGEGQLQTAARTPPSTLSMQAPVVSEMSDDNSKVDRTQEQVAPQPTNAAPLAISRGTASGPSLTKVPGVEVQRRMPTTSGKELVVQVAALRREADARELADNLRQKNFQAFVRTLPADALYRVMLGPYANTAAALTEVDKLKKAGFDSFVRRQAGVELSGSLRIATP